MNVICIIGRLCKDPELKSTQSGLSVTSVSVAVDRLPGDPANATDFIPCVFWRTTAVFLCKYFRKGDMIAITGTLQSRQYTDRYDVKHTVLEVNANRIDFCGAKREASNPAPERQRADLPPASDFPEDDEVPFK